MSINKDVVCHADGNRCLGCDHYHGRAPVCVFAPLAEQQGTPTPRTLEAALECAVETARTSARNDNGTWFLKVHGAALLDALRELSSARADVERMREALEIAVRQNSHDMVLTGDELRLCDAALAATRKEEHDVHR